jgi:hypothetical protein
MDQAQALIQTQVPVIKYKTMKKEGLIKNIIWSTLIVLLLLGIAILIGVMGEDNGLGGLFFSSLFFLGYLTFSLVTSGVYVWFLIFNLRNINLILHPIATFLGVSDIFVFIIGIFIMCISPQSIGTIICFWTSLVIGSLILYKQFKMTSCS